MTFVVDASVAIKWVLRAPGSPEALALAAEDLVAPPVFPTECANVLWKAWRRRELSEDEAQEKLADLLGGGVVIHAISPAGALRLGAMLDHSLHDCAYLALAMTTGAPMVTADDKFAAKVESAGLGRHVRRLERWRRP